MKRPLPPVLEQLQPPPSKRALTGEERELWESVARQARPLRKKRVIKPQAAISAVELIETIEPVAAPKMSKPVKIIKVPRPDSKPSSPPLAPLGRRERSQLSRGKKDIDARLDLHGMTQSRAHLALLHFLQRAHADGLTFVLVITGKGRATGTESERGVLRRQVPQWLGLPEFRSLVVSFDEAHIGHGGGGALYVRVRRAR